MSRTNHHGDKKKERLFKPWFWFQATPSWWTRLTMNKPQRRQGSIWQRNTKKTAIEDLKDTDVPSVSRKPHQYF